MRKESEAEFASLCRRHNIWAHKWTDVRNCPHCHRPIFSINRTSGQDNVPDSRQESIIDYLIFTGHTAHWVECKGRIGQTRFSPLEINPKQRNFLNNWSDRLVPCWLFLILGNKRAPDRKAWFIPWEVYKDFEEFLSNQVQRTVPWIATNRSADVLDIDSSFFPWEMKWEDGAWRIPENHPMTTIYEVDKLPPIYPVEREDGLSNTEKSNKHP